MPVSAAREFIPTRGELSVVAAILAYTQTHSNTSSNFEGFSQIDSNTAVDILQRSGLSYEDLANIWAIADEDGDGNLSERELAIAVRLMGWAQSGKPVDHSFLNYSDGPLPTLKDICEAKWDSGPAPVQLPPVNVHEKIEYHRAFREAGPVHDLLDGDKVRDVFIKSNLSYSELDRIWNLIDTQQRGSLTLVEFAVGMYLIQAVKTCQLTVLPTSMPPYIFDQLSPQQPSPFAVTRTPPKSTPPPWKPPSQSIKNVVTASGQGAQDKWDVSVLEQAEANGHFRTLDAEKRGLVGGDESARFMLKFSGLPSSDIAHIWDLVDIRRDNKLNREQLAVAVHLVHRRLEGAELPSLELPSTLVPPTMRPKSHPRRASASAVPQRKPPPPPVPPSLSRKASAPSLERRVSLSPPTPRRLPPSGPDFRTRFSTPTILESTPSDIPIYDGANATSTTPQILQNSLEQETIVELKGETKQLKSNIQELMVQLKAQNQYREQNEVLREDNKRLKTRLQEMEVSLSQALQASEGANVADDLSREVARLTVLLADHENTETELRETLHSVAELTQQNQGLKQQVEGLAQEKESIRGELQETTEAVQQLQGEKNSVSTRLVEMEKLLADPQGKGGSRRELRMLLKDVTKENEQLKHREREMQQSLEALLTSRNQEQVDILRHENTRLRAGVQELGEVIRQMESSSHDNELRRRINELEGQKEMLSSRLADMERQLAGVEGSSERRIGELQRQCSGLALQNEQLRRARRSAGPQREDENAPPPAYEEISIA